MDSQLNELEETIRNFDYKDTYQEILRVKDNITITFSAKNSLVEGLKVNGAITDGDNLRKEVLGKKGVRNLTRELSKKCVSYDVWK